RSQQKTAMQLIWKSLSIGFAFVAVGACKATPVPVPPAHACPERAGAAPSAVESPIASKPEVIGVLAGPGTEHPPPDLRLYGTDLGLTYEHDGKNVVVFGDTWMTPMFIC